MLISKYRLSGNRLTIRNVRGSYLWNGIVSIGLALCKVFLGWLVVVEPFISRKTWVDSDSYLLQLAKEEAHSCQVDLIVD